MLTLQLGNSAAYALASFPVGVDMQQFRPNSIARFATFLSKSDFPKTQKYWRKNYLIYKLHQQHMYQFEFKQWYYFLKRQYIICLTTTRTSTNKNNSVHLIIMCILLKWTEWLTKRIEKCKNMYKNANSEVYRFLSSFWNKEKLTKFSPLSLSSHSVFS